MFRTHRAQFTVSSQKLSNHKLMCSNPIIPSSTSIPGTLNSLGMELVKDLEVWIVSLMQLVFVLISFTVFLGAAIIGLFLYFVRIIYRTNSSQ